MPWTFFLLGAVAVYCIVQAVRDFRRGNFVMAALGAAACIAVALMPVPTHAVKVDLPSAQAR